MDAVGRIGDHHEPEVGPVAGPDPVADPLGRIGDHHEPGSSPTGADRVLAVLAEAQHGVVARAQLRDLGLGEGAIKLRVRRGRLHPLYRGVYAVGHRRLSLHPRWMAAVLACGPGAVLSHRDAAALWGLRPCSRPQIDVTVPDRSARRHAGIEVHRPRELPREETTAIDDIPTTTWARTLLDLAAVVPSHHLARALERAEDQELLDLRSLDALLIRHPTRAGARALRAALADHRPGVHTRSDNEALLLHLCREAGLPTPLVNTALDVAGRTIHPDALWPDRRLIVEVDGYRHHRSRTAFGRDRARDADLQELGFRVIRVPDEDLHRRPGELVARLRRLLR